MATATAARSRCCTRRRSRTGWPASWWRRRTSGWRTSPYAASSRRATATSTDLRSKLARYHADPDSAFWGWNDVWLDPAFRAWNIEAALPAIACPVLAVQGREDEYGTLWQIQGIAAAVRQTELLVLEDCGHSPHRDQPAALKAAVAGFLRRHVGFPGVLTTST